MKKININLIVLAILSINTYASTNEAHITISSATKSEQSIKDVTSNVEVITSRELEAKNITTISEALNLIVGLNYTSNGGLGQATSINLRGMSSKRILVLVDGIRYNDITGLNGASFENIILNNIAQIEVIKGAQSGIWGADASAGVINIITKKSKNNLSASVNAEIGSSKTKSIAGTVSYKTDKYYMNLSSKKLNTDGFSAQVPNGKNINNYENDGYKNTTRTLKSGFNINETNKIDLIHTIIKSNNQYDSYNSPNDTTAVSNSKNKFTSINFNHIDSFNTVDMFLKKSSLYREYPNGFTKEFTGEVNEYGLKSKIPYNKKDFIIWGIDYKNFEHKNNIDKKYNNKALFITNSNKLNGKIGGKTIFTQSLRRDIYNKFDNKTTSKIGLKHYHSFLKGFIASVNYGTAYNVPTLYHLYSFYGNENINPENIKSYDIKLEYKKFIISYFNTKITNRIDYDFVISKYNNINGEEEIKGYEISYSKLLTNTSLLNMNYTQLMGESIIKQAKKTVKISFDYFGIKKTHINFNAIYVGERFDDTAKTKQTGKYIISNLIANYKINKKTSIYSKINNITNKYYQIIDGYATSPRAIFAGVKIKF